MRVSAPLVMQDQDNPCNWILASPFYWWIGEELHSIPQGFVFDFASIPRLFWNIISPTELGDVGPLKHDWYYKNGIGTRAAADKTFLQDMKEDKIPAWKRNAAYWAVRLFGGRNWKRGKVVIKEVLQ